MGPTKVFVGNLSFKTKEAELADEFSTVGKVLTANIITRGYRSLGYGFVEFEKEEDARNALASLNKKSLHNREINVELATPREEGAPRPPPRPRRGGPPRGGRGGYPPREVGDSPSGENRRGVNSPRGARGGYRGGRNSGPSSPNVADGNSPYNRNDNAGESRPYNRNDNAGEGRPYNRNENAGEGRPYNRNENSGEGRPPRRGGFRRGFRSNNQRSPPSANRVPSTTTLFVANLPYEVTDEELSKLLPKASKAYVAKNYNGRSKGFGFVEFGNEEDQKAALAASEKLQSSGRDLIVKIALTEEKRSGNGPTDVASPAQQTQ